MVHFLEFYGMIASMTGAFLMSRDIKKYPRTMYYAFIAFMSSNMALFYVATVTGLVPLMVQMMLFFSSAAIVIVAHSENKSRDQWMLMASTAIYVSIMAIVFVSSTIKFNFKVEMIDTIAAIIAISGSFAMKSHDNKVKLFAFAGFFLADVLYVYIAIENSLYFFMVQSFFFWYTSIAGAKNVLANMKSEELKPVLS